MVDPSPEFRDEIPIKTVGLPAKVKDALVAAGLETVGDVGEKPNARSFNAFSTSLS